MVNDLREYVWGKFLQTSFANPRNPEDLGRFLVKETRFGRCSSPVLEG